MTENLLLAFGLTLFAGLATGIGSVLAFFTSHTNTKFLSITLEFSAGVMTSLDELSHAAMSYDEAHLLIYGLIGSMAVMALNLLLFI